MSLIITRNFKREKAQDTVARNADSNELNVGDKIWITQYGRNYPYTITKKWREGWTFWYKAKNDKSGKEEIVAEAFANALDAAAQDIQLPFIITFNNGKKEFREGYSEEEVRRRFDKSVAALYGGIKSVKLEDEEKRNGKDSSAADAKFKPNDLVEWRDAHGRHNSAFYVRDNGDRVTVSIEKNGQGGGLEIPKAWITNSRATDAGDAAEKGRGNSRMFFTGRFMP